MDIIWIQPQRFYLDARYSLQICNWKMAKSREINVKLISPNQQHIRYNVTFTREINLSKLANNQVEGVNL